MKRRVGKVLTSLTSVTTILTVFGLTLWSAQSSALTLEPILGYGIGNAELSATLEGDTTESYLGGRILFEPLPLFFFGAEYGMGSGELDRATGFDADIDHTRMGAVVGISIPVVPFIDRIWVNYMMDDSYEESTGAKDTYKGKSYGVGLGIKVVPFISFNVEYQLYEAEEVESTTGTVTTLPTAAGAKFENSTLMFSVSVPLGIPFL